MRQRWKDCGWRKKMTAVGRAVAARSEVRTRASAQLKAVRRSDGAAHGNRFGFSGSDLGRWLALQRHGWGEHDAARLVAAVRALDARQLADFRLCRSKGISLEAAVDIARRGRA